MSERMKLEALHPNMAERAVRARMLATAEPKSIEIDDQMLPWVYCEECDKWLSFDGNYSGKSPAKKRAQAAEWQARMEGIDEKALERLEVNAVWSLVRERVLERDGHRCTICGGVGTSSLHAHHICKRSDGGTDHMDNLATVCNRCHKKADTVFYDPDWEALP